MRAANYYLKSVTYHSHVMSRTRLPVARISYRRPINYILFFIAMAAGATSSAEPTKSLPPLECHINKIERSLKSTIDVLCDPSVGVLYLKHDQKKRLIWLEARKHKFFYPLIKLESNADPCLVGEEKSIAFITSKIISVEGRKFIGVTVAERSMRGNGMGQCGAGSEIYFISLEISETKILERKRFLVYSCIKNIYLVDDGSKGNNSITITDDQSVTFKWLVYPGYENTVVGSYNFITNELAITEDGK